MPIASIALNNKTTQKFFLSYIIFCTHEGQQFTLVAHSLHSHFINSEIVIFYLLL